MALIMVCGEANYLRVPSQHNLSVRATGVEAVDRTRRGRDTLLNRTRIAGSATRGLTTAGRIADSLSRGARVGREDRIHDGCRAAVAGAGRGLACSKDVDAWTRLALFEFRFAFNGRGIAQKAIASEQEVGSLWAGLHLDLIAKASFPDRMLVFFASVIAVEQQDVFQANLHGDRRVLYIRGRSPCR